MTVPVPPETEVGRQSDGTAERRGAPYLVKLVRDRVGAKLVGSTVTYAPIASREEFIGQLRCKLVEEAVEYLANPSMGELADVLEVVRALNLHDLGQSAIDLEEMVDAKRQERGGFDDAVGMYATTTTPHGRLDDRSC